MDENSSLVKLETEIAYLKRELELYKNPDAIDGDLYYSAKYWRDRCLKSENELNCLRVKNDDIGNRKKEE